MRVMFSVLILGVVAGFAGAAPARPAAAPAHAASLEARADWLDLFVSIMQDVLWQMGGDAQGLDTSTPDRAMASFRARFVQLNAPAPSSAALKSTVNQMDALLAEAPAEASAHEIQQTRAVISPLRAEPAVGSLTRSSP